MAIIDPADFRIELFNKMATASLGLTDQIVVYDATTGKAFRIDLSQLDAIVGSGGGGSGTVETIVAGTNVTVDATDPANPIINATGGADGADGADGVDGTVIRSAAGVPSDATGVNGDFYIDEASGLLYKRVAGVYEVAASLTGPAGPAGADGALGNLIASTGDPNDVTDGVDGDYYINMTNGAFWGPKTAGDWGASATGSLAGADGADGVDGVDGTDGADGTSGLGTKLAGTITSNDLAVDMAGASCVTVYASFNANINTVTITNYPSTGNMARVLLRLVCDGTQRTIAFTVNGQTVFWDGGTEPTTPSTSGHVMWIALVTGTAWSASNVEGFLMGGAMQ